MKPFIFATFMLAATACNAVEQTPACAQYVDCIDARDATLGIETNVDRFASGGDCWGSPEGQELCDVSCENGLAYLASLEDAPAECSP